MNANWDAAVNAPAVNNNISTLLCPSAPQTGNYVSDYTNDCLIATSDSEILVSTGKINPRQNYINLFAPPYFGLGPNRREQVTDGLSRSMMFFEDGGRPTNYLLGTAVSGTCTGAQWADEQHYMYTDTPSDICGNGDRVWNCSNNNEIYSFHPGGCVYLYGDGSVHFHPDSMDINIFVSLFTRAAGDPYTAMNGTGLPDGFF
jgi:prepilin-type processing-associated H-X9-DG protein